MPEKFPNINLVATVYGDDQTGQEHQRGQGPDRSPIRTSTPSSRRPRSASSPPPRSSPTKELIGKINVTGLALPSELASSSSTTAPRRRSRIWNPIDLGYSAVHLAHQLIEGKEAAPGATFSIGKVGEITLDDTNAGAMAAPFQFDKSNIEEFSKIY